jgi:hypothetical protein
MDNNALLNRNAPNVMEKELSVAEIRESNDSPEAAEAFIEKVTGWLDAAQGDVFTYHKVYLIIEVS